MTNQHLPSTRSATKLRPTIGVLATLPVYYGTDILRYLHEVLQGIRAAAVARECNLLIACGMDEMPLPRADKPAWPLPAADTAFVPVGPWNVDGLIVVGIHLKPEQEMYLREVEAAGTPIVYAGFVGPGRSVSLDNADGIRQALEHLHAHGHTRVAFIAGLNPPLGESGPRYSAYVETVQRLGMALEPALIAHGNLRVEGGRTAMEEILARGVPFTALLACNDASAHGAAAVLRERGYRIPDDVAVIGFDNLLESSAFDPPLTTIHNPTFSVGQQAFSMLLASLSGALQNDPEHQLAPVRLVVRRSCGCRPGHEVRAENDANALSSVSALAREFARSALLETRIDEARKIALCEAMVNALIENANSGNSAGFDDALNALLHVADLLRDDLTRWQRAFGTLVRHMPRNIVHGDAVARVAALIERGLQNVRDQAAQASIRALLHQENMAFALGLTSSQLLTTMNVADVPSILAEHLPQLNVPHVLVARYLAEDEDAVARAEVLLRYDADVGAGSELPTRFASRSFPPPGIYADDKAWQLALLPLEMQGAGTGFVVFNAVNLEPCATIVRSLAAVLRTGALYAEALHGRQQAEEASRLKGRFLSMVSHELRTPLSLIVGLSDLLLRDAGTESTSLQGTAERPPQAIAALNDDLGRIRASAQHLARLIGDVLDLASSDAGQLRLQREVLDLGEVLRPIGITGEQMARDKGLQWRMILPQRAPLVVGDRTRLRQVVFNLIGNAVKYTEHGSVTLEVTMGAGGEPAQCESVMVAVRDTGIGVAPDDQARIFGDFERGEEARRQGSGLGLGLAICRQLVELHGGAIGVESAGQDASKNTGSTFYFTLPIYAESLTLDALHPEADALANENTAQSVASDVPGVAERAGAPPLERTILVVDDDPGILELHSRVVREHFPESRLLQAHDGSEALEIMRHTRPDLLLLDLMMPGMDGFGVIEAMQAQESLRGVPVVVLTAQTLSEEEMASLNRGATSVLTKGLFRTGEVSAHLTNALEQKRRVSSATQRLVRQALVYMQQHSTESLSRREIAAAVGISEDYLTECFQQEMGISPTTWLQRYRIKQAQRLLHEGDLTVTEVALAVGFADSTHFGRLFQRETGVTPSAYRKGLRA